MSRPLEGSMANEPLRESSARAKRAPRVADDEAVDSFDVPAAVLCAFCGDADCPGCASLDDGGSGVIAIVPWERPGASVLSRLLATANATTVGSEAFFSALPDGEVPPAMRFAVLAELLAVSSMAAVLVPLALLVLPSVALAIVTNPALRVTVLRAVLIGVPLIALWMVAAHVTHGVALDVGARRNGGPAQRRRAVRYGLYACGWDLMAGPIGALSALFSKGATGLKTLLDASVRAPSKSSQAFLEGVYRLGPEELARARRWGTLAAVVLAVLSAFVFLALAAYALLS